MKKNDFIREAFGLELSNTSLILSLFGAACTIPALLANDGWQFSTSVLSAALLYTPIVREMWHNIEKEK